VQVIIILAYRKIKTPIFREQAYWELDLRCQYVEKKTMKPKEKDERAENWVQLYQLTLWSAE
jgi:hypothetical protein